MKMKNIKKTDRRPDALAQSRNRIAFAAHYRSGAGIHKGQGGYQRHPKHKGKEQQ
jgi:hypothetical protein